MNIAHPSVFSPADFTQKSAGKTIDVNFAKQSRIYCGKRAAVRRLKLKRVRLRKVRLLRVRLVERVRRLNRKKRNSVLFRVDQKQNGKLKPPRVKKRQV